MEERVRVCRSCKAIVGWFALFCETCGAKQEHGEPGAGPSTAAGPSASAAPPIPPVPAMAARPLENEIRTHISPAADDARAVARELFQTQLRLIHKHREGVEHLLKDVAAIRKSLGGTAHGGRGAAARAALDAVSERVFEAEQRWGELQVAYNRDAELIEEESREHMEAADFDAYLSPDENAKVETEFETLKEKLEQVDSSLRDVGRDLARARQESGSRYLGGQGGGGSRPWGLLAVTILLVGASAYAVLFSYTDDPARNARIAGPLVLALGIWVAAGFSRRNG
jgi:hypothetical protein